MSKGLEALEIIKNQMSVDDFPLLEHCRIIEKELMASDLLAEKPLLCVHDIRHHESADSLNEYIRYMYGYDCKCVVTDDEFALLKKVYGDR